LNRFCGPVGTPRLSRQALARLTAYTWPGNVRELENEIERMAVLAGGARLLGEELLSPQVRGAVRQQPPAGTSLPETIAAYERQVISAALAREQSNRTRTAAALGISRRNLIRKLQEYGLDKPAH
jgi:two-component system response regulator AtoC